MFESSSRRLLVGALALLATTAAGCGSSAPTTSKVTGQLDIASFPSGVSKLVLKTGATTVDLPLDAAGRFEATVRSGKTYELLADGVPLVVHATQARLDPTFRVRSGGSQVSLGRIHFVTGGSASDLLRSLPIANPAPTCGGEEEGDHDGDHEHHDGEHHDGEHHDGEHHDGADSNTGDHGDSTAEDTDCHQSDAMGLPEHNLPDEVGCGDEEDDDDDDGGDGDGEHAD